MGLMRVNQEKYFSGKISKDEHDLRMNQYQKRLAELKKRRLSLRTVGIKMLEPREIDKELAVEKIQTEGEIKKTQEEFYKDRKISEGEYKTEFKSLNERLAEIREEKTTLELLKREKDKNLNVRKEDKKSPKIFAVPFKRKLKERRRPRKEHGKKIKHFFKKIHWKINPKKDKRGIVLMNNEILDFLKKESAKRDCKGKYIKINVKPKDKK